MDQLTINQLAKVIHSIKHLENALDHVEETVSRKCDPERSMPILERIESYRDAIITQKEYAKQLGNALSNQDHAEAIRITKVINGISAMIRDDAREVVSGLAGNPQKKEIAH